MSDIKTFTLQRIVLPDADFSSQEELFYREKEFYGDLGGKKVRGHLCSFDTWMNLFAAETWYRFCDLGRLYLKISGRGNCRVDILGHTLSVVHGVMSETVASVACSLGEGGSLLVPLPEVAELEGLSLRLFYEEGGFSLEEAVWCTDRPPGRRHRLAVVCCTYRREKYVTKNIRKFQSLMAVHRELAGRLHMFVSDNGRSLPPGLSDEDVDIIPNVNAGGAGGFGRGLMAANDGGYTRCIFMDDDVEFCPESFLRVLALTEYLKEEHKDAFVNGAMMNLFDRTICSESLTVREGLWLKPYHGRVPVADLYGTLKCLNVSEDIYEETFVSSSWWFACFSLELYRGEYPIPCFIRGDDCEWSWRRQGVRHVPLNGVCVWHTPFDFNTRRMIDHYFLPRNMFLVHSLYNPDFRQEWFVYMNGFFRHFLSTYNYASNELLLSALRDILKSWESFREEPTRLLARLQSICRKAGARACDSVEKLERVREIGSGGRSVDGKGVVVDWFPSESIFLNKEKVEVYNLVTRKYEVRRPDPLKREWQEDEYDMLVLRIYLEYEALRENLKAGFPRHTGREFWDGYLGLAPGEEKASESEGSRKEIRLEEGMDLLAALEDALLLLKPEEPVAEQLEGAMQEAICHQLVLALEHYYAEEWKRRQEEERHEEAGRRVLLVPVTGMDETACGMDYLLGTREADVIRQWQEDDTEFICEVLRFYKEKEKTNELRKFLRECLRKTEIEYSDFNTDIEMKTKKAV